MKVGLQPSNLPRIFLANKEGEVPFDNQVVLSLPQSPSSWTSHTVAATAATAVTSQIVSIDQTLWESIQYVTSSLYACLFITVTCIRRNIDCSDEMKCHIRTWNWNWVPLTENLPNVGTIYHAAQAVGTWIAPTISLCTQDKRCSNNGRFTLMSWKKLLRQMSWNI